jgi:uncharacterized membrane protein
MFDKSGRWLLLASLLFNAALVGFTVAQFMRGPPAMMFMHDKPNRTGEDISQKTRRVLDAAFEAERPAMDAAIRAMIDARTASEALLLADPVDTKALDAQLAQMRASNMQAQEAFHRVIQAAAAKMTLDQRRTLTHILRDAPPGHIGPMGAFGPPGNPPWMDDRSPGPPPHVPQP